jgi:hypothetical protein
MFERIRRRNMALGRITLIERATPPFVLATQAAIAAIWSFANPL